MGRLFIGGRVEGRKPRPNPNSVFGYGRVNTYQGMDCVTTARELNEMFKAGPRGRRSRSKHKRGLDDRNLGHRADQREDLIYALFERARVLSLELDRANPETKGFTAKMAAYEDHVRRLIAERAYHMLDELERRERARGCVRVAFTRRRLMGEQS